MSDYQSIGYTKKTYGVKGELKLNIPDKNLEDFAQAEVLFLSVNGRKIPYFVEAIKFENPFTVKFEDINTKEAAIELTGTEIFMRTKDLLPATEKVLEIATLKYEKYINFKIEDNTQGLLGEIEAIVEYPQQEMGVLTIKEKEVLIPLNEQLIISIEMDTKVILMDLPEGLLELE